MLLGDKTICGDIISSLKPSSGKRIRYQCDKCGKKNETTYQSYNKGQERRNNSGETFCQSCASHLNNWNGGVQWTEDGYKNIRVSKGKYQREHRLIMEEALNRKLKKTEIIHHINEDKLDNRLENLDLCETKSVHQKAHHSLELIGLDFFKAGFVKYDKESHTYYVAHQKLREFLGHPEEGNQKPSLESNLSEGSTTSSNVLSENMKDHERGAPGPFKRGEDGISSTLISLMLGDDIV
jgi:hypothetical protein